MNTIVVIIVAFLLLAINAAIFIYMIISSQKRAGDMGAQSAAQNAAQSALDASKDTGMQLLLQQLNDLARTVDGKMTDVARVVDLKLNDVSKSMDSKLGQNARDMQDSIRHQSGESFRLIKDVTERLTKLDETNRQVVSFADQLQNLQDILKNPKQRGILGEYYLETLLKNVFPTGGYEMQHMFKDGTIVDAVVKIKDKIIPVDSKFSLENYNRLVGENDPTERDRIEKLFRGDLKNRIDETSKYIKPDEGTMDFAFMFIPHEAIYYELLIAQVGSVKINTRDLIDYAFKERHVIIVSPTSFLAYLQTVMQGLKALQIEESAKEILKKVGDLGKHIAAHEQFMQSLGNSLGTTVNHYNKAHKELRKIDKDVMKISGVTEASVEPLELAKPVMGGESESE